MTDAAKLREAIADVRRRSGLGWDVPAASAEALIAAAEAHLATLPKTKTVWMMWWRDPQNELHWARVVPFDSKEAAEKAADANSGQFVHVTGPHEVPA